MPLDRKYLESLVTGIKEVTGCAIEVNDERDEITEIHVTALTDRPARLIARDVDTLLKVKAGVKIDHRKIGVVIEHSQPETDAKGNGGDSMELAEASAQPSGPPLPSAIIVDVDAPDASSTEIRALFDRISVTHTGGQVQAEVTLKRGQKRVVGEASCADTQDGHLAAVVKATLEALLLLHEPLLRFAEPRFRTLSFGPEEVMVVYISAVEGRHILSFTGSAVIRQDPRQAAVLATLAALNRRSGVWPARHGTEFEIV